MAGSSCNNAFARGVRCTGRLLVEYMKLSNDQWPESWEDLLIILNGRDEQIVLRGNDGTRTQLHYAHLLREKVVGDWTFNPAHPGNRLPVTRPDGTTFPIVWEDPNEMVNAYLLTRSATQPCPTEDLNK